MVGGDTVHCAHDRACGARISAGWEPETSSDHDWGAFAWPEEDDDDQVSAGGAAVATAPEPGPATEPTPVAVAPPDPSLSREEQAAARAATTRRAPWHRPSQPLPQPRRRTSNLRGIVAAVAAIAVAAGIATVSPEVSEPDQASIAVDAEDGLIVLDTTGDLTELGDVTLEFEPDLSPGIVRLDQTDGRATSVRAELATVATVMRADPDQDVRRVARLVSARAPDAITFALTFAADGQDWCLQATDGDTVLHLPAGADVRPGPCGTA